MNTFSKLQFRWYLFNKNIPQLATFLQSPSYKNRRLAALKLGQLKDITAIPFLKQKLDDPVLKVAETALYAIEVISTFNDYPIDLQEYKYTLKQRKKDLAYSYHRMEDFKFQKESWIPTIKQLLKKPIAYGSWFPNQ
ncbi:MAG: HEAT repeat domain-containing protein [Chitinophagales bacterium]